MPLPLHPTASQPPPSLPGAAASPLPDLDAPTLEPRNDHAPVTHQSFSITVPASTSHWYYQYRQLLNITATSAFVTNTLHNHNHAKTIPEDHLSQEICQYQKPKTPQKKKPTSTEINDIVIHSASLKTDSEFDPSFFA